MPKRRPLTAGLKPVKTDPKHEQAFVYGPPPPAPKPDPVEPREPASPPVTPTVTVTPEPVVPPVGPAPEPRAVGVRPPGRVPLTTRIRADLAAALKRASLERQLAGRTPHTVQDILEEALEPWLRDHDHLT